ncbi:hypothetical protein [Cryobacterium sp. Hb1]|uniref:hypothetical protein n=1 Tax=Cryobacterium sp. Hb1 TaxID=1259147 RepID=UPI00106C4872|nr:hypothetical protein [Cryobacterium sp. Hb1]
MLEEERKSRLKDELRAVRESLSNLISTHGAMEGALYPFWKRDAAEWPERAFPYGGSLNPFADPGVQQEGRVNETAYRIMGAGQVLNASIRGARSMGSSVWDRAEIDRLTQWINTYANRAWKLPYFLLVPDRDDSNPWTGYRLADESSMHGGSGEYVKLVAQQFASGKHPGLAPEGPPGAETVAGFYDSAELILIQAVSAFLDLGDAAAEDRRALRRRRPKSFLRDDNSGDDVLAVDVTAHQVEYPSETLRFKIHGGKRYEAETYAEILNEIWTGYSSSTDNEPLALGRRQDAAARLASKTNRDRLQALVGRGIEPTAEEREILLYSTFSVPDQFRGDQPFVWALKDIQLVLVDDLYDPECYELGADVPSRPSGQVRFLKAQTERALLESIGEFVSSR